MRYLACMLLLILTTDADAQILGKIFGGGRRDRYCPGGVCDSNANHPTLNPNVPPEPEIAKLDSVIPPDLRIENRLSNCTWAAAEDVFVAAGYEQMKGICARAAKEGWRGASIDQVLSAAKDANIPVLEVHDGSTEIFDYARKEGVGVCVDIPNHSIVCLGLDNDYAYMLDNNRDRNGELAIKKWPRNEFLRAWRSDGGHACCPRKRKRPKDEPTKPITTTTDPAKPAKECNCDPAAVKALADRIASLEKAPAKSDPATVENTTNINTLTQNVSKLTELIANQSKSIDGLAASVSQLDKRVSALENRPIVPSVSQSRFRIEPVKP